MTIENRLFIDGKFLNQSDELGGVPQGSVLGPILFTIYITDSDLHIKGRIPKYADDNKLFNCAGRPDDLACKRNDLQKLYHWPEVGLMLCDVVKCKLLHISHTNAQANYYIFNHSRYQLALANATWVVYQR